MKKFFKNIGKKSGGSKVTLDSASLGATASFDGPFVGYDIREKDLPKLHKAAWTGDLAKVLQHVKKDASALDKENRTALHLACVRGHAQIVQELLQWHAKSNIGDNQARTPLLKAVECGQEECVKKLMGHRADVDAVDREGDAGLHIAIQQNHPAILRLLIKGGANVNLTNKEGNAPLHLAVRMKRDEITRVLLIEKADPDVQDADGRTPLMYACYDGSVTPVRLLLQHNVNMAIKDKKGFTAEDIANMTGQYACSQLLSDHSTKMRRSGQGSMASTPRSSTGIPSASTTPRDPLISNMLPASNAAVDDSDEDTTFSRNSAHDRGDDSWGDDSLSQADSKKKDAPKINLAAALRNTLPPDNTSDDGGDTNRDHDDDEEDEDDDDMDDVGHEIPIGKQNSIKSIQSHTSAGEDEDFSDDEEDDDDGGKQNKDSVAPRVSFKPDSEISEIKELTADEDTTDYEDEDSETAAKRPKLDPYHQHERDTGYTPTGVTKTKVSVQMNLERQKEDENDTKAKGELMAELGISDPEDISDPDISDLSESAPPLPDVDTTVTKQIKEENVVENIDSDWDSTATSEQPTPRPGILKNWKQHSLEQVREQKEKNNTSQKSEVSEWDSDLEDELDPDKPTSIHDHSQWDSTNTDGITPRIVQNLNTPSDVRSGSDTVDYLDLQPTPPSDFRGSSVEPVTSASLESSFTQPKTVVERQPAAMDKQGNEEEDDEDDDSNWDSDDDDLLPSESGAPPIYGIEFKQEQATTIAPVKVEEKSQSHSITEDVDEESISEWEIERQKEKEKKQQEELESQKLVEQEMEREREANLMMQKEWEEEEKRTEERLRKEAEEEAKREMEMEDEESDEDDNEPVEIPLSPKSPQQVKSPVLSPITSPGRRELKKVCLLSVKDFVRSSETHKPRDESPLSPPTFNVSSTPTSAINTTADSMVNETVSPIEPEIIEAVTSFSTAAPKSEVRQMNVDSHGHQGDSDLHNNQRSTEAGPVLDQNHTIEVTSFGRSPAPNRSRSTPTITNTPPNMHSDGMSVEDDDSVDLDFERPEMGSYLRGLTGSQYPYAYKGLDIPDDDVLSYTSTENGDSLIYQTNLPYGKDVLANMNLSDPGTVLKLQEYMHEQNKRLDQERNHRMAQDNKYRSLVKEKNELVKKVDNLTQMRSNLEQTKLDLEQKIRNLEYNFNEEAEMRKNSETLLAKTKEQLTRKEEQFTSEIEAKQKAELQMRNLQIELRSATNNIKQLEDEKDDFRRQLQNEKNARQMQEQLNEDQQKIQQALQDEHAKSTTEKEDDEAETEDKLEAADEDIRSTMDSLHKLRAENGAIKMELEKQRTRHREEVTMLSAENEELQNKIEEIKNDIKLNEEALAHATMQYNLQLSNMRTETSVINSVLDKEKMSKEKLETELESLKTRLHTSMLEVDKAEQARNEAERRLQHEKDEWRIQIENKDKEVTSMKDNTQGLLQRLSVLENKLNSIENELHISNTSLLERSNQLQQCQKDLQYYKSAQENFDQNYKMEKEISIKLQTKLEQLQEKMTNAQHENLTLRQQLETTQQTLMERSGDSKAEQYNSIIASLKTDHEKGRLLWEERNTNLSDQCARLKEENRNLEARRSILEQENSKHNDEVTQLIRRLSVAEATVQTNEGHRIQFQEERMKINNELDKYRQKFETVQEKYITAQGKLNELENQLRKAQENNDNNAQKLLNTSVNMEAFSRSKDDLEDNYQKLKLENAKMEAELKHERQRSEMIQKDLLDSQKVRNSLEALCANLKSTNAHLEDKLGHGLSTESGFDISQYEKQKQDAFNQLEEERRKHRKALEQKKVAETRLEGEIEKNTQLQKEVASLKTYLKVAKKRLKELDSNITIDSNKVENNYVDREDLERAKQEIEARYRIELNRKLEDVNNYLEDQARARERLDNSRDETEVKLKDERKKIQEESTAMRIKYEQLLAQIESKELEIKRFRDLYESEMQWRMRLSNQLMQTTDKAFKYKSNVERQQNRALNNMGNLTFSGTLNGHLLDVSRISTSGAEDLFQNKLKAELDRSISKHLEAAPHDSIKPVIRTNEDNVLSTSFAKSNADYLDMLKRKYCV